MKAQNPIRIKFSNGDYYHSLLTTIIWYENMNRGGKLFPLLSIPLIICHWFVYIIRDMAWKDEYQSCGSVLGSCGNLGALKALQTQSDESAPLTQGHIAFLIHCIVLMWPFIYGEWKD